MALMHPDVFEALRSVMPEEKAIQGATALYDAVAGAQRGSGSANLQSAATRYNRNVGCLASEVASVRTGMRVSVWIMAINVVLVTVLFVKVWFG